MLKKNNNKEAGYNNNLEIIKKVKINLLRVIYKSREL